MKPMRRPTGCPTCGWHWGMIRVRRGGRVRISAARSRFGRKKGSPNPSLRVYWPVGWHGGHGHSWVHCPDPWHQTHSRRFSGRTPAEPEPYTGVNRHDPEVGGRRKAKARRHREHQSKERR